MWSLLSQIVWGETADGLQLENVAAIQLLGTSLRKSITTFRSGGDLSNRSQPDAAKEPTSRDGSRAINARM
jgi:hypothetical protein